MKWLARRYWRAGDIARNRGDWQDARDAYRTAVRIHARHAPVWMQYGHALTELGSIEDAAHAYARAVALMPSDAETHFKLGGALERLGRQDEAETSYRTALMLEPGSRINMLAAMALKPRGPLPDRLGFVIIGTTGTCNASCIHCPTGKTATAHVPRTPMPMPLFERIIDEIADLGLPVLGQFAFGLFGDGLADPHVVARARHVRDRFPNVPISINTNAAAFSPARHAILAESGVHIGLHCESIVAETFDALMQPLRLDRVMVKYEQILAAFPGRVHVSMPVNRRNRADLETTRRWFTDRGARLFEAPMMSRCADDRSIFETLAFAPMPMRCTSTVLDDLSIDCDGKVLGCCQDFTRAEPIGDLTESSLADILFGPARAARARLLDEGRHGESATCSRCFTDLLDAHDRVA